MWGHGGGQESIAVSGNDIRNVGVTCVKGLPPLPPPPPLKVFHDCPCAFQVWREMTALSHRSLLTLWSDEILKYRPKKCTPQSEILQ